MTDTLLQLSWRAPWWGLLVVVPILLAWLARRRRLHIAAYAEALLRPWAITEARVGPMERWRLVAEWLAWLMLAAAAAGPRLPLEEVPGAGGRLAERHVMNLYLVLDLSASMQASDIAPNRLARAKLELRDLLNRLRGERVGLIVYAGLPGLLSPPSDDAEVLRRALELADPALMEQAGTQPAAALNLARQALQREPAKSGAILLVTDAESDSLAGDAGEALRTSVDQLATASIPLFVLGVGTQAGAAVPLQDGGYAERADGSQVVSRMAAGPYGDLARQTGGRFVAVEDGDGDWAALYDRAIAGLPGEPPFPEHVRAWRELYAWCLAPAILLLMLAHLPRWGRTAAPLLIAAALAIPTTDSIADENIQTAWKAYRDGHYDQAQTAYARIGGYAGHMGAGAAAWQLRDYGAAIRYYGSALLLARTVKERVDALYNLGIAQYGVGDWLAAVQAFQTVLQERPDDTKAATNLARSLDRLKKQRKAPPMQSDLKGRRGSIAEGEINLDWDRETAVQEFEAEPPGLLLDKSDRNAAGARLSDLYRADDRARADARLLRSGLKKLELLDDRPLPLMRGLIRQDAADLQPPAERAPW